MTINDWRGSLDIILLSIAFVGRLWEDGSQYLWIMDNSFVVHETLFWPEKERDTAHRCHINGHISLSDLV